MDELSSGSCIMAGFGICSAESLGSAAIVLVCCKGKGKVVPILQLCTTL
jgi:hypothetical protein